MTYTETKTRTFLKAGSWRVLGSLATAALVWGFTGQWKAALAVGGLEAAAKVVLYYLHERLWNRISLGRKAHPPLVVWLTGFSAAGKTTIADLVSERLRSDGYKVERLDGDTIRTIFPQTGFGREDRDLHVKRVGHLASRLESHGVITIVSLISPYRESRDFVRKLCRNFFEIHVDTPLEVCEKRDPKGLYARARSGELQHFTGLDDPYEPPLKPELRLDTSHMTPEESADAVLKSIVGYL